MSDDGLSYAPNCDSCGAEAHSAAESIPARFWWKCRECGSVVPPIDEVSETGEAV